MDPNKLLEEVQDLMALADAEIARGGRLHKAGDKVHPTTLADHHDKMAEYYASIADRHAAMSDAYATGKAAVRKAAAKEEEDLDPEDVETRPAGTRVEYGALESIRGRLSKRNEPLTRAALVDMLDQHDQNLIKSLVAILRPPTEDELDAETTAAEDALVKRNARGEDPSLSQRSVHKVRTRDVAAVPDRGKVDGDGGDAVVDDAKIEILQKRAKGEGKDAEDARIELEHLSRAAMKKAMRTPQVAPSGDTAGFRQRRVG